ncbi:type II toxin-antitoxin system HicB family antitoxin [Pseudanabaenaceae cyanobacterium LEGE 13415]|nr:type II toxin-antitoxin system HicB family antitoxin [Pseudanabaenaceae cyanobacterium LEGE 13415]
MQYQIFVQNRADQHFVASVLGMPHLVAEGRTEAEAIGKAKSALEEQLATGKLVTVNLPAKESFEPSMKYAGIFEHDSTFDDFMNHLAKIREEANRAVENWSI